MYIIYVYLTNYKKSEMFSLKTLGTVSTAMHEEYLETASKKKKKKKPVIC